MASHRLSSEHKPSVPALFITTRTSAGLLAVTVAVSAGIHIGLTPEHLQEMPRLGESFIVVSLLGAAIAAALIARPDDRRIAAVGGLFCLGQIAAWALFVTIRVPFFPGTPESVETIAVVSKAIEAVGVGLAAGLVWSEGTTRTGALRTPRGRAQIADAAMNFYLAIPMAVAVFAATAIVAATAPGASASMASANMVMDRMSSGTSTSGLTTSSITFGSYQPLSGPAAAGYSEIAPASQAYFDYVNAHGGVFGRKIHLIYANDAYNPTKTADVVHQLVERDHVFAMFEGVGPGKQVASYLNASGVPDIFVGSGCPCWDKGYAQPITFGWQPSSTIEGKILGQYIAAHFEGQKVGVLYQDDELGQGGLAGIEDEIPGADIVAKQSYPPGATTLAPQIAALKAAGAKVLVDFTAPRYTAMGQLTSFRLGYTPRLVVSNAGNDPTTVAAQLKTLSRGRVAGTRLINGAITDGYLPSPTAMANPWIHLFRMIHSQYDASAPFDSNVVYGMASAYTLAEALTSVGKDPTPQALVDTINENGANWKGPGLVPFRYSETNHGGFAGTQMGRIRGGKIELFGNSLTTEPNRNDPIRPYSALTPPPPSTGIPTGNQVTNGYVMNMHPVNVNGSQSHR